MVTPTFDDSGDYPSDETLRAIRDWPANHMAELFAFIRAAWHWPERADTILRVCEREVIRAEDGDQFLRLVTGGWSGNEEIVAAINDNLWARHRWRFSAHGGLHVYEVPR